MDHPTARDSEDYSHEKATLHPGKEFLFADMDEGPPSLKPYFFFCMMYCFNAIFILPFFIFLMVFKLFSGLYDNLRRCALIRVLNTNNLRQFKYWFTTLLTYSWLFLCYQCTLWPFSLPLRLHPSIINIGPFHALYFCKVSYCYRVTWWL